VLNGQRQQYELLSEILDTLCSTLVGLKAKANVLKTWDNHEHIPWRNKPMLLEVIRLKLAI
jgi:hypothetical protein